MTYADRIDVVVGGQYGSEGKGAVAAAMVKRWSYDLLVRVAGPNAGHTVIDQSGTPRILRQIPAAGIVDHDADLYIAPGSEVDLGVLQDDIDQYEAAEAPLRSRLYIDPEATVITDQHKKLEQSPSFGRFGSTYKGVGAARAERILRKAKRVADMASQFQALGATLCEPRSGERAMVEGTQGYWLGSHAGLYPHCTSSDCRAIDFLAMSGLSYGTAAAMVVFRSFPIRVAGNSGPLENEIAWRDVGVPPEYTSVTKKVRRVGEWEPDRLGPAIAANHIGSAEPVIAMTFMDYLSPDLAAQHLHATMRLGARAEMLRYIGNGPSSGEWL